MCSPAAKTHRADKVGDGSPTGPVESVVGPISDAILQSISPSVPGQDATIFVPERVDKVDELAVYAAGSDSPGSLISEGSIWGHAGEVLVVFRPGMPEPGVGILRGEIL